MADTTLKEGTRLDGLLNDHILYTDGGSEICGLAEHDAALIHDELRALRESHDALVEAAQRVKATLAWGLADSRVEEGTAAFLSAMVADLSAALEKAQAAAMEAQG